MGVSRPPGAMPSFPEVALRSGRMFPPARGTRQEVARLEEHTLTSFASSDDEAEPAEDEMEDLGFLVSLTRAASDRDERNGPSSSSSSTPAALSDSRVNLSEPSNWERTLGEVVPTRMYAASDSWTSAASSRPQNLEAQTGPAIQSSAAASQSIEQVSA